MLCFRSKMVVTTKNNRKFRSCAKRIVLHHSSFCLTSNHEGGYVDMDTCFGVTRWTVLDPNQHLFRCGRRLQNGVATPTLDLCADTPLLGDAFPVYRPLSSGRAKVQAQELRRQLRIMTWQCRHQRKK